MKKVSVVIPVYNQEKYLEKSLTSVINQKYDDIEIVIVDDGSTDSSIDIINSFLSRDKRINVVSKSNGGLVDATLVGIANSTGEYIAFLDPDDYWGEDFLYNLIQESDDKDVVASGFFYDKGGKLSPYMLAETKEYTDEALNNLRNSFLYDPHIEGIPNSLFFSRWNKIYKKEIIDRIFDSFSKCKDISLGEDTIFTYLVLEQANSVKTVRGANTYYYNIGNQQSMMKTGTIENYLSKARLAKDTLSRFIGEKGGQNTEYALYYYLIETIYARAFNSDRQTYYALRKKLDSDRDYRTAVQLIAKTYATRGAKIKVLSKLYLSKSVYWLGKKVLLRPTRRIKSFVTDFFFAVRSAVRNKRWIGYEFIHKRRRTKAFVDLEKKLPLLEKRIYPILKEFEAHSTDLNTASIEKNIFVFWWDGFENAPKIVKCCLASVKRNYSDCRVLEISKYNYREYTDINPVIEKDYLKGKISIQTFSDILRFNLLKNNGGLWIDSTIFFGKKFMMFENLGNKSFESLCFSTSRYFLTYEDISCSWSGYFVASRKKGLFTTAMDKVFEQYYLKYKTYSLYFFIDAAMMLAKKYKIDDGVLDKVQYSSHDMFLLSKLLNKTYDSKCISEIESVPQKLAWFVHGNIDENSFYNKLLIEGK